MGYYARFLAALPDVKSLSLVPEEQLLKLWEGLGYYSRARNLKKAAQMIMNEYGGVFPRTAKELQRLPGIGEYTAGAIASICFDEKVPAVDGNVLRVLSRIRGSRKNVLLPETKKEAETLLKGIIPDSAGDFNEAMMELGEIVCLPNGAPLCDRCPLREQCVAFCDGLTEQLPVRIKKATRKKEEKTVLLFLSEDGSIAMEKRTEKGLLSGMYQLPNVSGYLDEQGIKALTSQWEMAADEITFLYEVKHIFTHIEWHMKCYLVRTAEKNGRFLWSSRQELFEQYPLPTAFQKCLKYLK